MTLLEARIEFTRCLGDLLAFAKASDLDMMIDETKRHPMVAQWNATHCKVRLGDKRCERTRDEHPSTGHAFKAIGIAKSVHIQGLAADIYIIKNGAISNDTHGYAVLGNYWKTLHDLARWGGDFEDYGHFSFTWEGRL